MNNPSLPLDIEVHVLEIGPGKAIPEHLKGLLEKMGITLPNIMPWPDSGQEDGAKIMNDGTPATLEKMCSPGAIDGHKFRPNQVHMLTGMQDHPEFDGEKVTVAYISQDVNGEKCYYIRGNPKVEAAYDRIYEKRLS